MIITLNGKPYTCEKSITTIQELLISLNLNPDLIAIEHNGKPISQPFNNERIEKNDSIEIIHFVGGGTLRF